MSSDFGSLANFYQMTGGKPIKRSKQLAPFSREHHDSLLFAWKIKEGLKNRTPIETIAAYLHWFWNNHMKEHFEKEEKLLLPYLQGHESGGDRMGIQLKDEHEAIKSLMLNPPNEKSINVLATVLNDHIRFEERGLFPFIERKISPEQLDRIFEQLSDQKHCESEWSNEFWKRKKDG